jgi:aryl-alcohol dehydrogenase-like predicted oxidoreductase
MTEPYAIEKIKIAPVDKLLTPIALGGYLFGADPWKEQRPSLFEMLEIALKMGLNHFDTAGGYGSGQSEQLFGQFLLGRRDQVFLASKADLDEMSASKLLAQVEQSLARLQTETIDLFYIHWPRQGKDLRPLMEGLELARQQGKILAIGVSNFSVEQMEQVAQVGQINAHQLGYNLFWRVAEKEVIPYCREHQIAVVTYSSIAQGILSGKFPRQLHFTPGDQRADIIFFEDTIWPHVFSGVEHLKLLAQKLDRPLSHLAIRWVLYHKDINTAVVGARTADQVRSNLEALEGDIPPDIFDEMTEISDAVIRHIPDTGNMYRYYP